MLIRTPTKTEYLYVAVFLWLGKKATIHQLSIILSISKDVLFPGPNHLLTPGAVDPSLADAQAIIKILGHQHQWLAGGYDLEIRHF